MKALIVEDDAQMAKVIQASLSEESWISDIACTGKIGLESALNHSYDLIILDIMLPDLTGIEVVRRIRGASSMTPVLMLTALDSVDDRVHGLDAGADDYLTKPFDVPELLARVRALSRRKGSIIFEDKLSYGPITLSLQPHDGFVDGSELHLTSKEYELLEFFLRNAEQIVTREQIFIRVWGYDSDSGPTVVDVYVHFLRRKLSPFGCDGYIRTVRGVGYMLKE
ncbi:MAG: DNA-binding response regulator [Alicyclobacillus sp. RIFOXYA1_FULL_53_8]|nr:MAG: DNA-binding response regulator [Alicyclobacillus sp. RIFOXYA1_FULL_53_8]